MAQCPKSKSSKISTASFGNVVAITLLKPLT